MNILIVTHYYNIDGVIGSVRWTSLAQRLSKNHNVYVVTHNHGDKIEKEQEDLENINVIYIDNECDYVKRGNKGKTNHSVSSGASKGNAKRKANYFKSFAKSFLYMLSMGITAKKNAKYVCAELEKRDITIDYVVSTSRPFINCFTAFNIAKKRKTTWLLDQRDLPYTDGTSKLEINSYKYAFHIFDKYVSKYTLVSKGMADSFIEFCKFGKKQKDKTVVLNNGYDNGHKIKTPEVKREGFLSIAYVGDLYEGKRDATLLFEAINKVIKETEFKASDFKIRYAGSSSESLYENAKKYGLEEIIIDNGRVPHKEAIKMLQESDLLLLLTWNTYMDRGILPGKLYEYMMTQKPIVCITSGEIPGGEAEGMVNEMNLGVAVNYINFKDDVNRLASYLAAQLSLIKKSGKIIYEPKKEEVAQFDYDNLVKKLETIMFGVL